MRNIEHTAQLMFNLMGSPVLHLSQTRQVIVGNITRPEDLRASLIITGILLDEPTIIDNVLKYGHRDHITHLVVRSRSKISFKCVHHDIHYAAHRLVFGQGIRQLRIHDGKLGPAQFRFVSPLSQSLFVRQDAGAACLTACCRNRHNASYGEGVSQGILHIFVIDFPDIALILSAITDRLC